MNDFHDTLADRLACLDAVLHALRLAIVGGMNGEAIGYVLDVCVGLSGDAIKAHKEGEAA